MSNGGYTGDLDVDAFWSRNHGKWIIQIAHGRHGPRFSFRADQAVDISNRVIDVYESIPHNSEGTS